ncbi:hypothetical protein GGI02_002666 [Coemansia sp. RSA 2322]|nr:hypothetical protein GGI02_002666 [Coemansia sp. RSA 2322]KAJ2486953.1 hypothetical protein EV174_000802 [Coemansia sp. RSA 2320]
MRLIFSFLAAAAIALPALSVANAQQTQPACSSIYTRPEILSMSASQWTLTKSVLFGKIHSSSQFFPFHRRFIYDWERVARGYNGAYVQPYWDETRDYRTPALSQVLTSSWVGGNGQGSNFCVQDGNQAGWNMTYPSDHCFSRNFTNNGNLAPWYSPEYLQSIIERGDSMTTFRFHVELTLHGVVHFNMGGDLFQNYSPNDWIFMLHHANIDRLWWQWQMNNHMWTIEDRNFDNTTTTLSTNIAYYNEPISTVMQLGYGSMCHQYASDPIRPQAHNSTLQNTLINSLPNDVLSTWFPITAKLPAAAAAPNITPDIAASRPGKPIPYPTQFPQDWVKTRSRDPTTVNSIEKDARDFVTAMNNAGYKSPG